MVTHLLSGSRTLLRAEDHPSIEQIALVLAGAGLCTVRLEELQWAAIENSLVACQGNRTQAANALGISVRTLQRKLREQRWDGQLPTESPK